MFMCTPMDYACIWVFITSGLLHRSCKIPSGKTLPDELAFAKYPAKGFCQISDKLLPDERFCQMIRSSGKILPDEIFLPHVATVCQIGWSG